MVELAVVPRIHSTGSPYVLHVRECFRSSNIRVEKKRFLKSPTWWVLWVLGFCG